MIINLQDVVSANPLYTINSTAYAVRVHTRIAPHEPVVYVASKISSESIPSKLSELVQDINDCDLNSGDINMTVDGMKWTTSHGEVGGREEI